MPKGRSNGGKPTAGQRLIRAYALLATPDGGFALAGITWSYGARGLDMFLVKVNARKARSNGAKPTAGQRMTSAFALVATPDGGFALAGVTESSGAGGEDMFLVKVNAQGPGTVAPKPTAGQMMIRHTALVATPDGGFALAGYTHSYGAGGEDMFLVKVNAQGEAQWRNTYGGAEIDWADALVATPDGGFALAGRTNSYGAGGYDMFLVKVGPPPLAEQIEKAISDRMSAWLKAEQRKLEAWQQRGEFETNIDYTARMGKRTEKIVALEKASLAQQQAITEEVMKAFQRPYDRSLLWSQATLSRYDVDNQTFRVTVEGLPQPLVVSVPLAQAPAFKKAFATYSMRFKDKRYVLSDNQWVLVSLAVGSEAAGYHPWALSNRADYEAYEPQLAFDKIELNIGDIEVPQETVQMPAVTRYDLSARLPKAERVGKHDVAVIIGNRNYPYSKNVDYAHKDARMVKKYLVETFGFDPRNILYKEDAGKGDFQYFFGTEQDPKGKLYDYVVPQQSNVFVFYSGHGAPGLDDSEGYFVPTDAREPNKISIGGYPLSVFYKNLSKLPVKDEVTVVMDACFSGAGLFDDISPVVVRTNANAIDSEKLLVFSSSSGKEVSSWYRDQKHGMFTFFFLKAIHDKNADTNGDNLLTADEIQRYVSDEATGVPYHARRHNSVSQNPQLLGNHVNKVILEYK